MFRHVAIAALLAAGLAAAALTSGSSAAPSLQRAYKLRADFNGGDGADGKAKYKEKIKHGALFQQIKVKVEDAPPGDIYQIHLIGDFGDYFLGTVEIGPLGTGKAKWRTAQFIDEPGDGDPLPADFPETLFEGDMVIVGPLIGTFFED